MEGCLYHHHTHFKSNSNIKTNTNRLKALSFKNLKHLIKFITVLRYSEENNIRVKTEETSTQRVKKLKLCEKTYRESYKTYKYKMLLFNFSHSDIRKHNSKHSILIMFSERKYNQHNKQLSVQKEEQHQNKTGFVMG